MVTKEQALKEKRFVQIQYVSVRGEVRFFEDKKTHSWRANGKCKVWKKDLNRFELPIKAGLYSYGYLDNTNAHLFEVES